MIQRAFNYLKYLFLFTCCIGIGLKQQKSKKKKKKEDISKSPGNRNIKQLAVISFFEIDIKIDIVHNC